MSKQIQLDARTPARAEKPRRPLIVTAMSISIAVLLSSTAAQGSHVFPPMSGPYSRNASCNSDSQIDPVGAEFKGDKAGSDGAWANIIYHGGWINQSGSTQTLRVLTDLGHGTYDCRDQGHQNANGGSNDTRNHIRLWRSPWYSPATTGGYRSAGTPHREYYDCGQHQIFDENADLESGYDMGRKHLKNMFYGTAHNVDTDFWHNDNSRWNSCGDYYFSSSGYGAIIEINHDH